ncbi:MAG: septal ring lytic transglycosylase RlpA family protein [Mariprofundaceae bacterium]|nr:septal ring lytic transglycosylase RlpA family protein [Mariprofundaceae bacterium]
MIQTYQRSFWLSIAVLLLVTWLSGCAPTRYPPGKHQSSAPSSTSGYVKKGNPYQIAGKWYYPLDSGAFYDEEGMASWYGEKFHGRKTANGEKYDMYAMTAAHTVLPMPSMVLVTNLENGKQVKLRVNDRGPFVKSRLIDLSYAAAKALGFAEQGTTRVRVQTLDVSPAQAKPVYMAVPAAANPEVMHPPAVVKQAYIQLGAFSDKINASGFMRRIEADLTGDYPPLRVVPAVGVDRVRLGPFEDDAQAGAV